jgi:hypothetical protein
MVGHQHIGVESNPEAFRQGGQQLEESLAVAVVAENFAPLVAACGDMVASANQSNA